MEKLSPKESVEGGDTALRGSVRAPEGFSEGKPEAAKPKAQPQRFCNRGFAQVKSRGSPHTAPQHSVGTRGNLPRRQLFHSAPRIFNNC